MKPRCTHEVVANATGSEEARPDEEVLALTVSASLAPGALVIRSVRGRHATRPNESEKRLEGFVVTRHLASEASSGQIRDVQTRALVWLVGLIEEQAALLDTYQVPEPDVVRRGRRLDGWNLDDRHHLDT